MQNSSNTFFVEKCHILQKYVVIPMEMCYNTITICRLLSKRVDGKLSHNAYYVFNFQLFNHNVKCIFSIHLRCWSPVEIVYMRVVFILLWPRMSASLTTSFSIS